METAELTRLEQIARSLPCKEIQFERCDGILGEIYFAYGHGPEGQIHGLWGHCGVAMTVDFTEEATVESVRQVLVDTAHRSVSELQGALHA